MNPNLIIAGVVVLLLVIGILLGMLYNPSTTNPIGNPFIILTGDQISGYHETPFFPIDAYKKIQDLDRQMGIWQTIMRPHEGTPHSLHAEVLEQFEELYKHLGIERVDSSGEPNHKLMSTIDAIQYRDAARRNADYGNQFRTK